MAERAAEEKGGGSAAPSVAEAAGGARGEHSKSHARSWSESDSGDGDEDEMVGALEELVLEAYNNMQSDGEFIFLPDHVAHKLHEAARLLHLEGTDKTALAAEPSPEPSATASSESAIASGAHSASMPADAIKTVGEQAASDLDAHASPISIASPVSSSELGEGHAEHRREQPPPPIASRDLLPRTLSSELLFTDLAPVIEIDEEESSGPPSPVGDRSGILESHTSSSSASPHSMPPPPPSGPHAHSTRGHSASHHNKGRAASPATTPRTADKKESESSASTYEKRRQAALKLKEDKARRAQEKHDAAKKQREDARRELEEVQRKEMEEKRERVRRLRQQREHRKTATTTKKPAR